MQPKLIIITGAPGVGKSSTAALLYQHLPRSVWLDGDDLWRMNPFSVTPATIAMLEANIACCLRNMLQSGLDYVIFTWVLHRPEIIHRMLDSVADLIQ